VVRFRVRATGEERWSLVSARTVLNEVGTLELVVSIFRDVTDLKRSELSQVCWRQGVMALGTPLDFDTRLSNVATAGSA